MPLLDIITAQSSFQNNIFSIRDQSLFLNKSVIFSNEKRLAPGWKPSQVPANGKRFGVGVNNMHRSALMIKAVANLERKCLVQIKPGDEGIESLQKAEIQHQSPCESPSEEKEVDDRERLRRMRISKANKGNTPWNKGRKHSAETLKRIKERTRQAMQDPKVKMKLINLGHAQSEETRMKIGAGVRMGWEKRRKKLMLQEGCYFEWQNLIAESSRRGFAREEELQWDSYMILDERLEKEWLEIVEERKQLARPKGNRRAPKSLEQRRRISEAISAKWADPAYRERVCSRLSKFFGSPVGVEKKPKKRSSGEKQHKTQSPAKKKAKDAHNFTGTETKSQSSRARRPNNKPKYKDPLAGSKLEMIKNIRAQRAAAENKTNEGIEQAKLLIAEAVKAAKTLEAAAMRSPLARDSLIETRKLIAEAVQAIRSVETEQNNPHGIESNPVFHSLGQTDHGTVNGIQRKAVQSIQSLETGQNNSHGIESDPSFHSLSQTDHGEVNGIQTVDLGKFDVRDYGFGKLSYQDFLNGDDEVLVNGKEKTYQTGMDHYGLASVEFQGVLKQQSLIEQPGEFETDGINGQDKQLLMNGSGFRSGSGEEALPDSTTPNKKWVRGRLVEIEEGD